MNKVRIFIDVVEEGWRNCQKVIVFLALLFAVFSDCLFSQVIPDWVYHPPRSSSIIYGVGISSLYTDESLSFKKACVNAIECMTKQYHVNITTKLAEVQNRGIVLNKAYSTEVIDSLHYWQIFQNAVQVDSFMNERNAFVLMAVSNNLSAIENDIRLGDVQYFDMSDSPNTSPDWIHITPRKAGSIYGVGLSSRYHKMKLSWDKSAEEARIEIAMVLGVKHGSLERDYFRTESFTIGRLEQTANVELWGARIIERWYNPHKKLFYTLVETEE